LSGHLHFASPCNLLLHMQTLGAGKQCNRLNMQLVVQTQIHIFLNDGELENNGL